MDYDLLHIDSVMFGRSVQERWFLSVFRLGVGYLALCIFALFPQHDDLCFSTISGLVCHFLLPSSDWPLYPWKQ